MQCFWVEKNDAGEVTSSITQQPTSILDASNSQSPRIRIQVEYSSLNYKDALAATGNPGIVRKFPHIPGIDAVGRVIQSADDDFQVSDQVIVTGNQLGVNCFGAWAEQIDVPSSWAVPLPDSLTPVQAMALGTAGFTAAQCVGALINHGVTPESGSVVVTGATGGVASLAISLLVKLGYSVVAVTGKESEHANLKKRGVEKVLTRSEFVDDSKRPLLSAAYAAAVDSVGGKMLETLLRTTSYRGCIAACGLTGGSELNTTVYPFLLRGITLCGIDSAMCPLPERQKIWQRLAGEWKLDDLDSLTQIYPMDQLKSLVSKILAGEMVGRAVIKI
ncbi:YhdH/YhfP family quinone oxidoreductase [Novipirellula sp. SH528]|uniref:YhdH/YhfP family quinone oxidoreductase n=1 Tax=Novipirellula sp. SH528 TaxID=3454466 RepID=UPI003FA06894